MTPERKIALMTGANKGLGLPTTPAHLDVTDQDTARAAAERVEHDCGRLDVLVNNAGTLIAVPAPDITADHFRDTYETNVFGVVTVTRLFLPLLRRSSAPRVVNVASTTASHALTAPRHSWPIPRSRTSRSTR